MIRILITGALVLLYCSCKPTLYTIDKLPDKQLRWGSGGGFVGKETSYTLLENGQLFYQGVGKALAEVQKTKAKKAKNIFKSVENLKLTTLDFKHPGNTYSYIEVVNASDSHRIIWGDKQHTPDARVQNLYQTLGDLVKNK
jgi:hypothetical protein